MWTPCPNIKLIDVLAKLLNHVLAPLNEEDLLDILALREFKKMPLEDILQMEEIAENFDERDKEEIQKDKEATKIGKQERRHYKARLKEMRKTFREKAGSGSRG